MRTHSVAMAAAFMGAVVGSLLTNALWLSTREARAGDAAEKVLRAERFELVDGDGKVVGSWDNRLGSPGFHMRNADMNGGVWIGLEKDGRVLLTVEKSNVPLTKTFDPNTKRFYEVMNAAQPSVTLEVDKSGQASLEVRDGKKTFKAP